MEIGCVEMWWTHGLIPKSTGDLILQNCNLTNIGPLVKEWKFDLDACGDAQNLASTQMGDIDIYNMYIVSFNFKSRALF